VLRSVIVLIATLALAACSMVTRFAYVRADGQDISGDPTLTQQFNRDRATCQAEMHRGGSSYDARYGDNIAAQGDAVQDCMEDKGYIVVMERDADAKQQELAAKAAEKARREAEAAAPPPAPPPPPPPPHKVKTKPKPKPEAPATASSPPPAQPKSSPN
jgi:hypothetical protein